jgi:ATP-binding protein involved in chromosome partitioning
MFRRVDVPVLGVVENMSYFACPCCGDRAPIFGEGGGETIAEHFNVPLLGQIPILADIREGGDSGSPVAASTAGEAGIFSDIAQQVAEQVAVHDDAGPQITIS